MRRLIPTNRALAPREASCPTGLCRLPDQALTEVLCTATAEALAMGKKVLVPRHPSTTRRSARSPCCSLLYGEPRPAAAVLQLLVRQPGGGSGAILETPVPQPVGERVARVHVHHDVDAAEGVHAVLLEEAPSRVGEFVARRRSRR